MQSARLSSAGRDAARSAPLGARQASRLASEGAAATSARLGRPTRLPGALLSQETVHTALHTIATLAKTTLPWTVAASVTVVDRTQRALAQLAATVISRGDPGRNRRACPLSATSVSPRSATWRLGDCRATPSSAWPWRGRRLRWGRVTRSRLTMCEARAYPLAQLLATWTSTARPRSHSARGRDRSRPRRIQRQASVRSGGRDLREGRRDTLRPRTHAGEVMREPGRRCQAVAVARGHGAR